MPLTADPALDPSPTEKPLRVLQFGLRWFADRAGGAARYYRDLCEALAENGVDVRGLLIGSNRAEQESAGRIRAFGNDEQSSATRLLAARRALQRSLAEHPPDLVTSHFALFALPNLDLLARRPFVVHFHGPWAAEARAEGAGWASVASKRAMERLVYRRADRLIVLSAAFRDILAGDYGIDARRIRVVPGGVEVARFAVAGSRAAARAACGWPTDRPIVLAVRRLSRRMGLDSLITAMATVRQTVPEALLLVAGSGPLLAELEAMAKAHDLGDHVRFLGFIPEEALPTCYRAADLVVMPSLSLEGFGLTVVEALAAGTPVMATPVGGMPEILRDLDPSLVFAGSDPAAIADGIADALRDPGRLPSAEACAAYAARRYDWRVIASTVADVYREVL